MKSGSGDSPQKQMKEPTISLLHIVDRRADKPSFKVLNDKDVERIVPLLQKKSP